VYSIAYELNGGENNPDNPGAYTVESGDITLKDPSRTGYTFTGWTPSGSIPAGSLGDMTFTANWMINTYAITWNNEDGTVLETDAEVPYGMAPSYDGATPEKAATAEFTYTFSGWSPEVSAVTGDVVYTAQYTAVTNTYTVTFVDYDGTVLGTDSVTYGSAASAPGDPSRTGYTFTGWDMPLDNITGDMTVSATYRINTYTVTFVDYDGTVLGTDSVTYGGAASAPADPSRTGYTFTGWDMPLDNITGDMTVTATYEAVAVPAPTPLPSPVVTPAPSASPSASPAPSPTASADGPQVIDDEPVPASGTGTAAWAWWLLLIPLLLLLLLLLLLYNVSVMVYGQDGQSREKRLRTVRRLKRRRDEVIVSLKDRDVSGSTHGMVELTKTFTRRMRDRRLTIEVENARVISVVVPDDADGRFQARIDRWKAGR
jgi:uncharacterized repeat protein (TIGR02543 family)